MIVPKKEDLKQLKDFEIGDFERWLRTGLEGYLLEDEGVWAFDPLAVFFGHDEDIVLDLRNIYRVFSSRQQGLFRQAVANLIANLGPIERNVPIFERLLQVAAILPAGSEVLPVLSARVANTEFFGLTKNREGKSLFDLTMLAVTELTAPTKEAVDCLHALIASPYFESAYAGLALASLCRADGMHLTDHMERLRWKLDAMFRDYKTDYALKRQLAKKILDSIGLEQVALALPERVHSDYKYCNDWFLKALFVNESGSSPLLATEQINGKEWIYRPENPEVKVPSMRRRKPSIHKPFALPKAAKASPEESISEEGILFDTIFGGPQPLPA